MYSDRLQEALKRAAVPTRERIRRDCERLPEPLSRLVAYVGKHLFEQELTGTGARRATGCRSHSLPAAFRAHLGTSLRTYIEVARMAVADRLLRLGEFEVGWISMVVGYRSHDVFLRAYKDWSGELPSEVGSKPDVPEIDYSTWRRAWRRELEPEVARDVIGRLAESYGEAGERIVVDGEDYMRVRAEEIWREIRDLAPEEQRRRLRRYEFRSEALFDLLRETSRREGRRDRQRGVHLAELALLSLETCAEFFGERIHDLRALGHACVGNAYRLARDFSTADQAFERAQAEWQAPRRDKDSLILAKILDRKVALRTFQRSYGEASRLVERARDLYRSQADARGEARSLLQLSAIHGYTDRPEDCIAVLRQATKLMNADRDPELAFVLYYSLSIIMGKVGRHTAATEYLSRAKAFCRRLNDPIGALNVQWVDAMIRQESGECAAAESLLIAARVGYADADELNSFAIISLDLAILYAQQGRWSKVIELAAEVVRILDSLGLYEETLAAVSLLAEAAETGEVPLSILRHVQDAVSRDPLAGLR